jgi:uncharacterized protein YbaR (Trm112 family)
MPLALGEVFRSSDDGSVIEGLLQSSDGRAYPVNNGIPRFVLTEESGQRQTETSFAYKWQRTGTYSSPTMPASAQRWMRGADRLSGLRLLVQVPMPALQTSTEAMRSATN